MSDKSIPEPTIFDITKERLVRAGKKIQGQSTPTSNEVTLQEGNFGFKIFEAIPNDQGVWSDYNFEAEEFEIQQKLFDESKLTESDLKTLLITWKTYDGIALTQELEKIDLIGYTAYYGKGKLYLMNKGFTTDNLKNLLEKIDSDKKFNPTSIIAFGYHFDSKNLRELSENVKSYANKKNIDIDFITRY